jgi:hypothetical protein
MSIMEEGNKEKYTGGWKLEGDAEVIETREIVISHNLGDSTS